MTTLGRKGQGASVNIEVDVLSKYVERHISARQARPSLASLFDETPREREVHPAKPTPAPRPAVAAPKPAPARAERTQSRTTRERTTTRKAPARARARSRPVKKPARSAARKRR
jgi:hypothetical protein